jgi:hypothetical protein
MSDLKVRNRPAWCIGGNTMTCRMCSEDYTSSSKEHQFSQHGFWTSITSEQSIHETAYVCSIQCSQEYEALVKSFYMFRDNA